MQAARESDLQVGLAEALKGVRVADVMNSDWPTVDGGLNIQNFVEEYLLRTGQRRFVVEEQGQVTGLITAHEVKGLERAKWPFTTVHEMMRPFDDLHSVSPDVPLMSALETMGRYDLNQLPVISNHHLDGVLTRAQLLGYVQTHAELRR